VRLRQVGDAALTLELGEGIDPVLAARVRELHRRLLAAPFPGYLESVPTYRSLLVCFDPSALGFEHVAAHLRALTSSNHDMPAAGALHEIPTLYGGEHGPDLAEVAARCGRTEAEVVALHAGRDYDALMLGFTPGFAYLGLLAPELQLARRATPRTSVPAGSVGIAGPQTAIYPSSSPGGWHLIGRASVPLFEPRSTTPVRIQPGDRVRFVPVPELPQVGAPRAAEPSPSAVIDVLDGGLLTSVQALPRRGLRHLGITASGPLDLDAHMRANRLVGNADDAATLECTLVGPTLRFLAAVRFAICGADLGAALERADLGTWPVPLGVPVLARPGNVLVFEERRAHCRAYVAFAGGLDVPELLGSRATDLKAGFGGLNGRALRAGDALALLTARARDRQDVDPGSQRSENEDDELVVRVVLGPQDDHFAPEVVERLLASAYTLSSESDRFGARLDGPRLEALDSGEFVSDGLLPGCIQVPPDGRPIVTQAEGPTTGGYSKIATIVSADLASLAQLVPGRGRVRFTRMS
jgi:KipI family sensor histidine kinase inhibitor